MVGRTRSQTWFATCPRGLESLLADELQQLGAESTQETVAGVHFTGPRGLTYRACLWSRLANRVLWPLAQIDAADGDELYRGLRAMDWGRLFAPGRTIAVDCVGTNAGIRNTQFGAQRSKDAVVDWFRDHTGQRPSVDRRQADVRISVRLQKRRAQIGLDMSGGSLHQRGYRLDTGAAPLKENLAAALLLRADWPGMAARGGALVDPMCGGGTLLIEGAMMAADIAPGLSRKRFGFSALNDFDSQQWQAMVGDARARADRGRGAQLPEIRGYDASPVAIRKAQENIARVGLEKIVRVSARPVSDLRKPTHRPLPNGLLISNPPYGERLGEREQMFAIYRQLGEAMQQEFKGWQAALFTSDIELGKATGLRSYKRYALRNGALQASLLLFDLRDNRLRDVPKPEPGSELNAGPPELSPGAQMFANRLRKNVRRLRSWVKREQIHCYRVYDADMPEYAVAVDLYGQRVHVAEYRAPDSVSPESAARRLQDVRSVIPAVFGVDADEVVYKERQRQRGSTQYVRRGRRGEFYPVQEGKGTVLVNLTDYLDTGLFLDHRPLRRLLAEQSCGKDVLNLFCYTGVATVQAILGGARTTTSVDLSNTYLDWLRKNLAANHLSEGDQHRLIRQDCRTWLDENDQRFDLILLDPPSFSNSKSMEDSFDVQRDHVALIEQTLAKLKPGGRLYFSTNRRGFRIDAQLMATCHGQDVTRQTLDPDFRDRRPPHQCWVFDTSNESAVLE
ncbi:MAG: bifunctional 23S rRNA (guanine(2069)-N(7))-methyltransferase RlmK/23S rRNA (guanine(2445)-N(2))-methyltransferase RlmL [Pseudomonadota bacterium]